MPDLEFKPPEDPRPLTALETMQFVASWPHYCMLPLFSQPESDLPEIAALIFHPDKDSYELFEGANVWRPFEIIDRTDGIEITADQLQELVIDKGWSVDE